MLPSGCRSRICRPREAANRRGDRHAPGVNLVPHRNPRASLSKRHYTRRSTNSFPVRPTQCSPSRALIDVRWLKVSCFCPRVAPNKLALSSERDHNRSVKRGSRLSRLCGWSVRCISVVLALAFCATAFAADTSKNVVVPATTQHSLRTAKKVCYTPSSTSGIPVPCDRLSPIPTTTSPIAIYRRGTTK